MNIRHLLVAVLVIAPGLSFAQGFKVGGDLNQNCQNKVEVAAAKKLQEKIESGALGRYSSAAQRSVKSSSGASVVGNQQILVDGKYMTMVSTAFNSDAGDGNFHFEVNALVDDECRTIQTENNVAVTAGHI